MQQRDSPYSTPFLHEQEKCDFFMSKEKTHSQKHTLDWTQTQKKKLQHNGQKLSIFQMFEFSRQI